MKAITLHQPWANLIADGYKTIETRGWPTNHRGLIAIHAGRKSADEGITSVARSLAPIAPQIPVELWRAVHDGPFRLGAIVATACIVDCIRMDSSGGWAHDPIEHALGFYAPDRYSWILTGVQKLERPVVARGAQGIWELPDFEAGMVADQVTTFEVPA